MSYRGKVNASTQLLGQSTVVVMHILCGNVATQRLVADIIGITIIGYGHKNLKAQYLYGENNDN